jgi:hypothetical protein
MTQKGNENESGTLFQLFTMYYEMLQVEEANERRIREELAAVLLKLEEANKSLNLSFKIQQSWRVGDTR